MMYLLSLVAGFLLGSVPFGLLVARAAKGIDIREHGSGNIGATNVARVVGKGAGFITFLLDVAKGLIPALVLRQLMGANGGITAGVGAIAGHIFSPFLRFKGGKGVATGLGVFMGLAPMASGAGFLAWLVFFFAFRWVSLASVAGAIAIPSFLFFARETRFSEYSGGLMILAIVAALVVLIRHRANIGRLFRGKEPRFSFRKDTVEG